MTNKKCPYCFSEMDLRASVCPSCKQKVGNADKHGIAKKHTSSLTGCLAVIFALFLIGIISSLIGLSKTDYTKSSIQGMPEVQLTDKGKKIKAKYPSWPNGVCNTVAKKEIHRGMIAEQVKAAWGKPQRINETVGAWGTHEQWVYGDTYVYFENGLMTSWQSSK